MRPAVRLGIVLAAAAAATAAWSQTDREPRIVALQGEPAPGVPPGVFFDEFEPPLMNRHGHVAFLASLTGPGVLTSGDDQGIWIDRGSGPELLVLMGTQNPTLDPRWFFDQLLDNSLIAFGDGGHVVFDAFTRGPGVDGRGYYIANLDEPMTLLYQEIVPLEGEPWVWPAGSVQWRLQGGIAINEYGQFAAAGRQLDGFSEPVVGGVGMPAQWLIDPSEPVIGAPAGTTAAPVTTFDGPAINDNGQVVFEAFLLGPSIPPERGRALLRWDPDGTLTLVALEGTSPPGVPDYEFSDEFTVPSINNRGEIVFADDALNFSAGASSTWRWNDGSLELVAQVGDPADGVGIPDSVFRRLNRTPVVNAAGTVAFFALAGPTINNERSAAWIARQGIPPRTVVVGGDPAPGLDDGSLDVGITRGTVLTDDGRMVLSEFSFGGDALLTYIADGIRPPEALVTASDRVDLDARPDRFSFRSIQRIEVRDGASGGEDGYPTYVSAAGAIAARVTVRNPTTEGIFVFEPEPVCLADTNGDGAITPADFNSWILAFNSGAPECDQNNDGMCTPADFNGWILNFNAGCP